MRRRGQAVDVTVRWHWRSVFLKFVFSDTWLLDSCKRLKMKLFDSDIPAMIL